MSGWDYWHKQTAEEPLFPGVEWSKPESKARRGKLLVIGGHAQGFNLPIAAGELAAKVGAGEVQILLPDELKKLFSSPDLPLVFAASTPIGSFAKDDGQLGGYLSWADHVLLAGDLGRNSETALFVEKLISVSSPLTITKDSFYYAEQLSKQLLIRPQTTLVGSFSQLRGFIAKSGEQKALNSDMSLVELVEYLHELTRSKPASVVTHWQDSLLTAHGGQVATTKMQLTDGALWELESAVKAAVYTMQQPSVWFEALTASAAGTENRK